MDLQQAYLKAGIVTAKWATDALHVALAAANHCKLIVSWNFKHIVHFDKIPLYNGVNLINGSWSLGGSGAIKGFASSTSLATYLRCTVRTLRNAPGV